MLTVQEGDLLWEPSEEQKQRSNIYNYMSWLKQNKRMSLTTYDELWEWSVNDVSAFWGSLWEYFNIISHSPYKNVVNGEVMPNIKWFEGAEVNYAEHVFRNFTNERPAMIAKSEIRSLYEISWQELYEQVASFTHVLKSLGISRGDRVVAYVPNIHEAVVAFLSCASIGAIWSSSSPDFGAMAVIDRFKQIEPKILITVDGYRYQGKDYELRDTIKEIEANIHTLENTIVIPYLNNDFQINGAINWNDCIHKYEGSSLSFTRVSFSDPLWILFSSGTTGLPKAIVHGHGGIVLEHLKYFLFHADLKENDRFFWYTTTGWMMWNVVVSSLLNGTTAILYDGSPVYPNINMIWKFAEETKMTTFGTSAGYLLRCMNEQSKPKADFNLQSLRSIFVTASPLPPEGFRWVYDNVKEDIWLGSMSGGTDVCTAFVLHSPLHSVRAGLIQTRALGADVRAFDEEGHEVFDEVGELVLTKPLPSMPIFFWNDKANEKYEASYFSMFPNVWRHGDWIKIKKDGSNQIYGRSDATINRGGIRIGTSEIYRAIETMDEIDDSLIVDLSNFEGRSFMPLFVVLNDAYSLDERLKEKILKRIRQYCSPRHVPDGIYEMSEIPRTINDKKMEVPIKKILMGIPPKKAINLGSMKNPELINYFLKFKEEMNE